MIKRRSIGRKNIELLKRIRDGLATPSQLMYMANLSWKTLQEHLFTLKGQGLIKEYTNEDDERKLTMRYMITDEGLNALRFLNRSISILDGDETTNIENWR